MAVGMGAGSCDRSAMINVTFTRMNLMSIVTVPPYISVKNELGDEADVRPDSPDWTEYAAMPRRPGVCELHDNSPLTLNQNGCGLVCRDL